LSEDFEGGGMGRGGLPRMSQGAWIILKKSPAKLLKIFKKIWKDLRQSLKNLEKVWGHFINKTKTGGVEFWISGLRHFQRL
jgi:hypothetical protein